MKRNSIIMSSFLIAAVFGSLAYISGCGGSTAPGSTTNSYATSSTSGDFSTWSITGSNFTMIWNQTSSTGAITKTINLSGTCGSADATYGYKTCTVSSSDTPASIAVGAVFDILEVPGVALIAHPHSAAARRGSGNDEIHVGFTSGDCTTSGKGDYVFVDTVSAGVMGTKTDLFGIYRQNDTTFSSITHVDMGMNTTGGTSVTTNYSTGTGNGADTLTTTCTNGVRTSTMTNGSTIRGTITSSGLFFLDLPFGSGGMIAFKTSLAGAMSDLASKTFVGISYGGTGCSAAGGCTNLFKLVTGAQAANRSVPVTSLQNTGGSPASNPFNMIAAANTTLGGARFTGTVAMNGGNNYGTNAVGVTYANPSTYSGLVYTDEKDISSQETPTVFAVMKDPTSGKTLIFGTTTQKSVTTCGSGNCIVGKGNFIAFSQ